jgi:hypothetical protein
MERVIRRFVSLAGFPLVLVGGLLAQETHDDPQRMTLTGLRKFALHVGVYVSEHATLQRIDETLLRTKAELAMRRAGISIVGSDDVRDANAAQISLLYLVIQTRSKTGQETGFAASSCLRAAQTVNLPRLSVPGRPTYAVVPTWISCGIMGGDNDSYRSKMLQNADEQIARFLNAWRTVNIPKPAPPLTSTPDLGFQPASANRAE